MKRIPAALAAVSALALTCTAPAVADASTTSPSGEPGFTRSVLATGLGDPYEIVWGPDNHLWATEKSGLKVTRVDPTTGARTTALDLTGTAVHTAAGQDGVLGLAFQTPRQGTSGSTYVYLSYTYQTTTPAPVTGETRRLKIARYTLDRTTHTLVSPKDILTGLPSGTDHQSARLRLGSDGKLYYTVGDQGANQLEHYCNPNWAQRLLTRSEVEHKDWFAAYQGKILRINLDGSIPADNPVINGVRSHIITYGHRNSQGLDFAPNGTLYQAEQGPKTDDEINIVRPGHNYGWPYVAGYRDDQAYTYNNWSASTPTPCKDLTYSDLEVPDSVPQQKETDWKGSFVPPIDTLGTSVGNDYNFADPKCAEGGLYFVCWPTIAPSSLSYYPQRSGGIRGWGNSLIVTTLKDGSVYRLKLSADGRHVVSRERLWTSQNRYRDTAFSPDGKTVYVATDNAGLVRNPSSGAPATTLDNPGSILAFHAK
ncbi:glucose/sorbosone family PQQ-dependent dehydrogenase [Streptomyces violaceusniger]|uniref:Quinoprotein glucose dehydrogenase n=1 Tax=Streptomyces violaceusniger TaxID=68280 RepID=A0A4D4LM91_STRVO|nr:quinoprotein glucose dehydrogenase [Streptomyces violaceusniger]